MNINVANIHKEVIRYEEDPNGKNVREFFKKFIADFTKNGKAEYRIRVEAMVENEKQTLVVDGQDLMNYDVLLYNYIIGQYYRVQSYINEALQQYIFSNFNKENKTILYNIHFTNITELPIRNLKTKEIGKLHSIKGTITRTGQVQPELYAGAFVCSITGKKSDLIEQQFKYTEPTSCGSMGKHKWTLIPKDSIFTDFQKIKLQEASSEIPPGSMPRSIDIILRNELCEKVKPGDQATLVGTLLVVPDVVAMSKVGEKNQIEKKVENIRQNMNVGTEGVTGLAQCGQRDLNYKLVFIACGVDNNESRFNDDNQNENNYLQNLEEDKLMKIRKMRETDNFMKVMAESICPTIYGHQEIKKGILLQMIGGLNKKTQSGISLRGDINICVVGDPSTAKSQFLKYVTNFLPRSVYTSGKASTSAGLTASVVRDPETNDMCIEAGALMLADHGVCCIDEFDKMDEKDQVAIHEAMEQQTISIAKAGIHATLNARASILAAANPVFGKYDKSKPLKFNLQMSAPLMSRFDLFFVVLDETNEAQDTQIANYILEQHRGTLQQKQSNLFSREQMYQYIKYARNQIKPIMTKEAAQFIQQKYSQLRMNDVSQNSSYKITVRQLESLIRLSEAIARLFLDENIQKEYVEDAARLLSTSILKIEKPDIIAEEIDTFQNFEQQQAGQLDQDIANQQQQQRKLDSVITMTYDHFENIAHFIVQYVQREQKTKLQQKEQGETASIEDILGIKQQDIAEAYVTTLLENEQLESLQESNKAMKIVHTVIQRLIQKEQILIVIQGDDINYRERILTIHQNYTQGL